MTRQNRVRNETLWKEMDVTSLVLKVQTWYDHTTNEREKIIKKYIALLNIRKEEEEKEKEKKEKEEEKKEEEKEKEICI
jgi:hypothetical protein